MKWVIPILLVVVVLLSGCGYQGSWDNYYDAIYFSKDPTLCCKATPVFRSKCYLHIANAQGDVGICEKMGQCIGNDGKNTCLVEVAGVTGNASICDKLPEDSHAREECYTRTVLVTKDPQICEKIKSSNKDYCYDGYYYSLAVAEQNSKLCEKISDLREVSISDNTTINRYRCYQEIAIATGELSLCDKVEYEDDYGGWCPTAVAIARKNSSFCDGLGEHKGRCYYSVAGTTGDYTLCSKSNDVDWCYETTALMKKDIRICDEIESYIIKPRCYMKIAILKKNLSICEKLQEFEDNQTDSSMRNEYAENKKWCYAGVTQNMSACKTLNHDWGHDTSCVVDVVVSKDDPTLCKTLFSDNDYYEKWGCYESIIKARETNQA